MVAKKQQLIVRYKSFTPQELALISIFKSKGYKILITF
jgi:hypothetical protein